LPQELVLSSTKPAFEEVAEAFHVQPEEIAGNQAQAKRMLMGLGFSAAMCEQGVDQLSVGWRMKVILAKLLMQKADFYLLDEPTNHLDLFAKDWFLKFLKSAPFGFLLVCHDKYFLNTLCTNIFELENGNGTMYKGNYDAYEIQKKERNAQQKTAYELQQRDLAKKRATAERFRASATKASMAQSMFKAIEKTVLLKPPVEDRTRVSIHFPPMEKSAREVLLVQHVSKHFGEKTIFQNTSFHIERGQKVALVAPNGMGKTTLLKLIIGEYPPETGRVLFGDKVSPAFFAQEDTVLKPNNTIWEEIANTAAAKATATTKNEQQLRAFLGAFLFSGDDVYKKISVLSGGEKNRVRMVKTLLQNSNFLILDEPTNHLDIPSKEVLLAALQKYPGTILFVSHDHDFINKLATETLDLTPEGATLYKGNYQDCLAQKEQVLKLAGQGQSGSQAHAASPNHTNTTQANAKPEKPGASFEQRKKVRRMEEKIERTEKTIAALSEELTQLPWGSGQHHACSQKLEAAKGTLKQAQADWESLVTQLG
jgi:ATP-binding cassette subfamily F protein 3